MKRILVIRFSALGDVAMVVPVVRALAEQHPDAEITMLSQHRMADLFAGMPGNVRFHGVDLKQQSLREIVAGLGSYDLVADLHGVWRSLYVRMRMRLRGAGVATINKGRRAKRRLIRGSVRTPLPHTTTRYAEVFQQLGLPVVLTPTPLHTDGKGIGVAPFAAHPGKCYPLERMEQVVAALSERGEKVVLFGGKEEAKLLDTWAAKYPGVTSVAGRHTLGEELALMRGLRVMLTMDSANMHLASLVGTRVVSVWGATHPYAGFLGYGQKESDCVQRDLECRPCSVYGNKACKFGDYRCLSIAPTDILEPLEMENGK